MTKIFVSWYDGYLSKQADLFNRLLEEQDFELDYSPASPHHGYDDPRWKNWYEEGLPKVIRWADVFIAVMTEAYESTWMMIEYDETYRHHFNTGKPSMFFVRFCDEKYMFRALESYLNHSIILSGHPQQAVSELIANLNTQGIQN